MTDALEDSLIAQVEHALLHPGELQPGMRIRARTTMQFLTVLINPGQIGTVIGQVVDAVLVKWDDEPNGRVTTVILSAIEEI